MLLRPARRVEWYRISKGKRIGYAVLGIVMIAIFAAIAWLDVQARSTGALDMALMGGMLGGGGVALVSAVLGKDRRRVGAR